MNEFEVRVVKGGETLRDLPENVFMSRDMVGTSAVSIASVCNCAPELVTIFLNKLKEQVLFQCFQKKKDVQLNLLIGCLTFTPQGTVEFSSNNSATGSSMQQSILNKDRFSEKQYFSK